MTDPLPPPDPGDPPPEPPAWRQFARAPLVPPALAASAGLCGDRYLSLPPSAGLLVAAAGVAGWLLSRTRAVGFVFLAVAGLAATHHRHWLTPAADDLCRHATPAGGLVHVRGVLTDDPAGRFDRTPDPLAPVRRRRDAVTLRASHVRTRSDEWVPASGLARLSVERDPDGPPGDPPLNGLHAGDLVEVVARLSVPQPPGNPGESDYRAYLRDQGVHAELWASDPAAVVRLGRAGWGPDGWVYAVRRHATRVLLDTLPPAEAATAAALLLGDGTALDRAEWDAYVRTGVVHALAISGQHLAVLAGFVWLVLRAAGVRRVRGAWLVLALIVAYTVVTGLRPSGVRAMVMVAAVCGGLVVGRPVQPANAFALGWLAVIALNPADPFTLGCQLSFLSVFVQTPTARHDRWQSSVLTLQVLNIPQLPDLPLPDRAASVLPVERHPHVGTDGVGRGPAVGSDVPPRGEPHHIPLPAAVGLVQRHPDPPAVGGHEDQPPDRHVVDGQQDEFAAHRPAPFDWTNHQYPAGSGQATGYWTDLP